ncbi:MAG: DsbC family protein [Gammaproteobacteria bacterium]
MRLNSIISVALTALLASGLVQASDLISKHAMVQEKFPDYEVTRVAETPLAGLLEVTLGSQVLYMSEDGKYFLTGELYDYESKKSLTEQSRLQARAEYLESFKSDNALTFVADDEKYRVMVFTDIDCPYCRKLHREMAEYNEKGITVQYLAFPRQGPGTAGWAKAEEVWCSATPLQAMDQAKGGQKISGGKCESDYDPVATQYRLGKDLGIAGTPAILRESGEMIVGYRSADELIEILESEG